MAFHSLGDPSLLSPVGGEAGASERTLHRRFLYGGKKGRAAARRLKALRLTPGYTRDGWRILLYPYVLLPGIPIGLAELGDDHDLFARYVKGVGG